MKPDLSWIWKVLVFLGVLLVGISGDTQPPAKDSAFVDRLTLSLCEALESKEINERYYYRNRHKCQLSTKHLHNVVTYCYEAACLNPKWGSREKVTVCLLDVIFNESRFDPYAINYNKNCSVDVGIIQPNSIHFGKTWRNFCRLYGLTSELSQLYDARINIMFGAYVNEMMMKEKPGRSAYRFHPRGKQKILYQALCQEVSL